MTCPSDGLPEAWKCTRVHERPPLRLHLLRRTHQTHAKGSREAGFYTSQDGSRYPRLQLLTIKDLLEGNKNVQRPEAATNLTLNLNGE
jgi:hypothetical protein